MIKNNAVQATKTGAYAIMLDSYAYDWAGLDITNNIYKTTGANFYWWNDAAGGTLATWNALTGVGTDLNADPLFVSATNFNLKPGSPAINAGTDVNCASCTDLNGDIVTAADGSALPRFGGINIGAYENKQMGHLSW